MGLITQLDAVGFFERGDFELDRLGSQAMFLRDLEQYRVPPADGDTLTWQDGDCGGMATPPAEPGEGSSTGRGDMVAPAQRSSYDTLALRAVLGQTLDGFVLSRRHEPAPRARSRWGV